MTDDIALQPPDRAVTATETASFWDDPPWRGGRTPFRMGLAPILEEAWLPESICENEYQRKLMLLDGRRDAVLAQVRIHAETIGTLADAIRGRLLQRGFPDPRASESHPLARAALMVPDDLCVLVPGPAGWLLAGACLCSPSFWRLSEKIGRPIHAIHGPVAGLEAALGSRITRFLDNLPVGPVFQRRNWNIHRSAERFHPEPETWDPPVDVAACAGLVVRSERQTLRKFDDGALLFTIGVSVHPLAQIVGHPRTVADLLGAIASMSADEREAFGYRHHGDPLVAWLASLGGPFVALS